MQPRDVLRITPLIVHIADLNALAPIVKESTGEGEDTGREIPGLVPPDYDF